MTIETDLFDRLNAQVLSVAGRVRPNRLKQKEAYPAISFQRISSERPSAMSIDCGIVFARFQIDVWAERYHGATGARDIFDTEVRPALQRWRKTTGTPIQDTFLETDQDLRDPDADGAGEFSGAGLGLYRVSADFRIIYEE